MRTWLSAETTNIHSYNYGLGSGERECQVSLGGTREAARQQGASLSNRRRRKQKKNRRRDCAEFWRIHKKDLTKNIKSNQIKKGCAGGKTSILRLFLLYTYGGTRASPKRSWRKIRRTKDYKKRIWKCMDKYATEREPPRYITIWFPDPAGRWLLLGIKKKVTDLRQSVRRDFFFNFLFLWETNQWNYTRRYTHTHSVHCYLSIDTMKWWCWDSVWRFDLKSKWLINTFKTRCPRLGYCVTDNTARFRFSCQAQFTARHKTSGKIIFIWS